MEVADLASFGQDLPIVGVILTAIAVLLVVAAAAVFVVAALVFIGELLLIGAIVGVGLLGRVLFGHPWTVVGQRVGTDEAFEWRVEGWRASQELVRSIAVQLEATGLPTGGSPAPSRGD